MSLMKKVSGPSWAKWPTVNYGFYYTLRLNFFEAGPFKVRHRSYGTFVSPDSNLLPMPGPLLEFLHPADLSFFTWDFLLIFVFGISYHNCTVDIAVIWNFKIPSYLLRMVSCDC